MITENKDKIAERTIEEQQECHTAAGNSMQISQEPKEFALEQAKQDISDHRGEYSFAVKAAGTVFFGTLVAFEGRRAGLW